MSKPPDDLCICALVAKAYPEFDDDRVTRVCRNHWEAIKAIHPRPSAGDLDQYARLYDVRAAAAHRVRIVR